MPVLEGLLTGATRGSVSLLAFLEQAAATTPDGQLVFYTEGLPEAPSEFTYSSLLENALSNAKSLLQTQAISEGDVVLLHFGSQAENVLWFWSLVAANAIPAVSTPLAADATARTRHLIHLRHLLELRTALTSADLMEELAALDGVCVLDVSTSLKTCYGYEYDIAGASFPPVSFQGTPGAQQMRQRCRALPVSSWPTQPTGPNLERSTAVHPDTAFLMLTSGSTGKAKAVEIHCSQLFEALQGKIHALDVSAKDVFLNWIGFDHVACLAEVHLLAMAVNAPQIHVEPSLAIRDPTVWLKTMSAHRATYTFAPNSFLAAVCKAFGINSSSRQEEPGEEEPEREDSNQEEPDLSALRIVVTGGEANTVSTGLTFNALMQRLGAPARVLAPAFGMTETCAGSIYNRDFPELELKARLDFCAVGHPTVALQLRITGPDGRELPHGAAGNLELCGPAVVRSYHNSPETTTHDSFTADGWFRTGDTGFLMEAGQQLVLSGRTKDSLIINGVKYFSHELEMAVEEQAGPGLVPTFTSAFATRLAGAESEDVVVTFRAVDGNTDDDLANTATAIAKAALVYCSKKPVDIIPLPLSELNKSSLGKLSRTALKTAYEAGHFTAYADAMAKRLVRHRASTRKPPRTPTEKALAAVFANEFDLVIKDVGLDDSLVHMGVDSIRLLRYKNAATAALRLPVAIDTGTVLTNPSIGQLATALDSEGRGVGERFPYNPVVVLQTGRRKAPPIWFVHPGLGEVLVFLNVSSYFADRRVYALRAPGFNAGEEMFDSFGQMTDTYMAAILQHQSEGPFILIGYSFGSAIAFETAKKLEAAGHRVGFVGSLNGPPHIKWRMVQINESEMMLNIANFLGLLTEEEAVAKSAEFSQYSRDVMIGKILSPVPASRLRELDLTPDKLARWADVATALQALARDYDPTDTVRAGLDVFCARPLLAVGCDRARWLHHHLGAWDNFAAPGAGARHHNCPGAHYTLLDAAHVFETQKVLRAALRGRSML